ncbi:MAG: hypothetical protein LBQ35_09280 [Spirochaetaceae bacterium]|jgi:class 3 adenylate cyclase|nr:hypothetical protein [Spirochaetaceae bacterium]
MPVLFSRKNQLLRFLVSLAAAAAAFFAGNAFLAGPRLGPHYDFLTRYSPPAPAARDIAIIETGAARDETGGYEENILEPSMVTQVILALTEFGSRALIVHAPVLGVSSGGGQSGAELQDRFDEEFVLLGQNIRNLFQGIRVGSIPPGESERYVEDLVNLSERGKERLLSAFVKKDEAGALLLERASDIFGQVWRSGDLRLPGPDRPPLSAPARRYTRAQPDRDGVFRRVAPALNGAEHIAFAALKGQFQAVNFVSLRGPGGGASRLILVRDGEERMIPLDSGGAILPRRALEVPAVRRVALGSFLDYERLEENLARLLQTAEARGCFAYLDPEAYPNILYRYARALRDDMLESPGEEKKLRWLDYRARYFRSLETLLDGPSEARLVAGYEGLIASEGLDSAGINRIIGMRDEVISLFARLREMHRELRDLRGTLSGALSGAVCVMGTVSLPPAQASPARRPNPTDTEVSVILANSLITGGVVTPALFSQLWPGCLGAALLALLLLRKSGPLFTLIAALILALLEAAVLAFGFVFSSFWMDPLLPAFTTAAAALASFITALSMKAASARRLRMAYQFHIAPAYLRQVIRMESPRPEEARRVKAAIVAVRQPELRLREMRDPPDKSAEALRGFREDVFRHFSRTGGVFAGAEGDMAIIAYGSPLERVCLNSLKSEIPYEDEAHARSNHSPAAKALGAVMDFLSHVPGKPPEAASWTFGIDAGECVFGWSAQGGYAAFGPPVIRARSLSSLTSRYRSRILVSAAILERTEGLLSKRIDVLRDREGTVKEPFYQIITEPAAAAAR